MVRSVKGKAVRKYAKKQYTPEQIESLLQGYVLVAKDKWDAISIGSQIRYVKTDGTFVRGGFVTNHWSNAEGVQYIQIENNTNPQSRGYATWPMAYGVVGKLYKKEPTGADATKTKTAEIIMQVNKLVDIVKQQKNRLDIQEIELRKLFAIVKQLSETSDRKSYQKN